MPHDTTKTEEVPAQATEQKPLRVLYISTDETRSEGVRKKFLSQVRLLNELGVDAKGLVINSRVESERFDAEEKVQYVPVARPVLPRWYPRRWLGKRNKFIEYHLKSAQVYQLIERWLHTIQPDVVLFRYPLATTHLVRLLKRTTTPIVFEHNTLEVAELKGKRHQHGGMGYLYWSERLFARRVLRRAAGIVGVTDEIVDYELRRSASPNLPHGRVSNSFDFSQVAPRVAPRAPDITCVLLLLAASPVSWHGVDRVIRGMSQHDGQPNVKLIVAGEASASDIELAERLGVRRNVDFVGNKSGASLDHLFDKAHVGIAPLALHRKGLRQASPLKTREYCARGLPFIYAYDDSDVDAAADIQPYALRLPNGDASIDLARVVDFARFANADRQHPRRLREYAVPRMDSREKARQLAEFLRDVKEEQRAIMRRVGNPKCLETGLS